MKTKPKSSWKNIVLYNERKWEGKYLPGIDQQQHDETGSVGVGIGFSSPGAKYFWRMADRMKHSRYLTRIFIVWLIFLQGCAALESGSYHKPIPTEGYQSHSKHGGFAAAGFYFRFGSDNSVITQLNDVEIGVRSTDGSVNSFLAAGPILPMIPLYIAPQKEAPNTVLIEIHLKPKKNGLTFNPMNVNIKNSKGMLFEPVSYVGPKILHEEPFLGYRFRYPRRTSENIRLSPDHTSCFVLDFDFGAFPDWDLVMSLDGIKERDEPVAAQPIRFERGSAWYFEWMGYPYLCDD